MQETCEVLWGLFCGDDVVKFIIAAGTIWLVASMNIKSEYSEPRTTECE